MRARRPVPSSDDREALRRPRREVRALTGACDLKNAAFLAKGRRDPVSIFRFIAAEKARALDQDDVPGLGVSRSGLDD
jgi:hypothetical protein